LALLLSAAAAALGVGDGAAAGSVERDPAMGEGEEWSADEGRSWRQLLAFGFKGRRRWWNRLRKKKSKREGFGAVFG
jgi:hypothetical protein